MTIKLGYVTGIIHGEKPVIGCNVSENISQSMLTIFSLGEEQKHGVPLSQSINVLYMGPTERTMTT